MEAVENPKIGTFLASVIEKALASPIIPVSKKLSSTRLYPFLFPTGMYSRRLPPKFTLRMDVTAQKPTSGEATLIILHSLSKGRDGACHVAANTAGKSCVVKFFKVPRGEDREEREKQLAEKEALRWNEIWEDVTNVTAWTTQLKGREHVLVMPYVRTLEDKVGAYEAEVREAISHMARKGYKHPDLRSDSGPKWHHVGVRVVEGKLKAVLVDLTDLHEIDKDKEEEVRMAENEMLEALRPRGKRKGMW